MQCGANQEGLFCFLYKQTLGRDFKLMDIAQKKQRIDDIYGREGIMPE